MHSGTVTEMNWTSENVAPTDAELQAFKDRFVNRIVPSGSRFWWNRKDTTSTDQIGTFTKIYLMWCNDKDCQFAHHAIVTDLTPEWS